LVADDFVIGRLIGGLEVVTGVGGQYEPVLRDKQHTRRFVKLSVLSGKTTQIPAIFRYVHHKCIDGIRSQTLSQLGQSLFDCRVQGFMTPQSKESLPGEQGFGISQRGFALLEVHRLMKSQMSNSKYQTNSNTLRVTKIPKSKQRLVHRGRFWVIENWNLRFV